MAHIILTGLLIWQLSCLLFVFFLLVLFSSATKIMCLILNVENFNHYSSISFCHPLLLFQKYFCIFFCFYSHGDILYFSSSCQFMLFVLKSSVSPNRKFNFHGIHKSSLLHFPLLNSSY